MTAGCGVGSFFGDALLLAAAIVAANIIRALRRRRRINSVTAHCYVFQWTRAGGTRPSMGSLDS